MRVVGVVGPSDSGKTTLVERLAARLDGRVGTVKHLTHAPDIDTEGKDTARHRAAGAHATYGLTDAGEWFATGADGSLAAVLEALAPHVDYAVVEGFSSEPLPQVELGGRTGAGETLLAAPAADAVDLGALLDDIDALPTVETLESLADAVRAEGDEALATLTVHVGDGAAERVNDARAALAAREDVVAARVHRGTGVLAPPDAVFVVVAARSHRAARDALDATVVHLNEE